MKTRLTIAIVWATLAGTLTFVAASSLQRGQDNDDVTAADAVPAYEVAGTLRSMGFNPISQPVRSGAYYVLNATDPRGVEVRVVADAQGGDIVSVAPAQAWATPRYERGPRIIHVPQAGERNNARAIDRPNDRASVNERDEPDVTNDDDSDDVAPPRRRAAPMAVPRTPRWAPRSESTPPKRPADAPPKDSRRAVLRAPLDDGPTPVRPTPKFNGNANAKAEAGEKFGPPRAISSSPPPPPIGYVPPAALPQAEPAAEPDSEK